VPKPHLQAELNKIVETVGAHAGGLGVDALLTALGDSMPRRTVQRRLAQLVDGQIIRTIGVGRATRYQRALQVPPANFAAEPVGEYQSNAPAIPMSPEGTEIRAYIRLPRQQRRPVGYKVEFLEAYQPNVTAYLPAKLREQLYELGRSPTTNAPAGTFVRDILSRLLIDLSWASSKLEGNTYTRLDTERLIEFGQSAEGKDAFETQMILNHKAAIEYLVYDPVRAALTPDTVIALHALLSDGLMPDPLTCGRIRHRAVDIGGSVYLPIALPQRLEELFGITISIAAEIRDPFEQAFFLMVHLPYLQPFEDVNKRVSRLAANIPFIAHNLCPLSFVDVPQQAYVHGVLGVYELNRVDLLRDVFVWAYARSCQQYVAVKQHLVPPDTFRLRYRAALNEIVAAIIRNAEPAADAVVRARMPLALLEVDRERFVALVLSEFKNLHAGNVVRFGLRPLEFAAWEAKHRAPD
jgi:hypothetical protein